MPQVSATALLQLALLLSAVPAQYFISRWYGTTAPQRFHATSRLLRIWKDLRSSYLNGTAWTAWIEQHFTQMMFSLGFVKEPDDEPPTAPAIENMILDNDQGYFGASKMVRKPRPPYVFLRVGEVVMESKGHMIGVVISWDPELRAPTEWVDRMYSDSVGIKAEKTPHYKVLFSGPEASSLLVAYLPQTHLERISGVKPNIPTLDNYFTHFDGERFVMQPWLRALFPEDEDTDDVPT
uniref:Si:dkey-261l7.2 n=1 Tax=Neogobius melanostomus TaxID=47308 RepID=A0A8C6SKD3_9GOBI